MSPARRGRGRQAGHGGRGQGARDRSTRPGRAPEARPLRASGSASAPPTGEAGLRSVARPKQARSEETLRRILEVAEALIAEKGLADVSIPDIVRQAGSSVGGFYARFRDKNELLRALEERFFARLSEHVDRVADPALWQGVPAARIVESLVHELVETALDQQNMIRAFMTRSVVDPDFHEEALRFRSDSTRKVLALLADRAGELSHPEPVLAIDLAVQTAFSVMLQHVLFGGTRADGRLLSEAVLERELVCSFSRYLGLSADAPRDAGS